MNRRLFVTRLAVGLVLPLVPAFSASAAGISSQSTIPLDFTSLQGAANLLEAGGLGQLQTLLIGHTYSPDPETPPLALSSLVRRDAQLLHFLLKKELTSQLRRASARAGEAPFGSHASSFEADDIRMVWQRLAYVGSEAKDPVGSLYLTGSQGSMHINLSTLRVEIARFDGPVLIS